MTYQKPKGTRDIYGRELDRLEKINALARDYFRRNGYEEIRTPTFEFAELFIRSVGANTDIVEKEMYVIEYDDRKYVLKPEGTAPLLRAVLENQLPLPGQFLYIANMYRKEKPQKGRYREFQQIGVEILGEADPFRDADLIGQADIFFRRIGIERFSIELNSIGCSKCRPAYKETLVSWLKPHSRSICEDCRRRFERNYLRIFDCKIDACRKIYQDAPKITDNLCPECAEHYRSVKAYLGQMNIGYRENKALVRGLDYYTRTVFEFKHPDLGAQDTFMAGGRYDQLMEELGGENVPAIGWAMGVDRLLLILPETKPELEKSRVFFISPMGRDVLPEALRLRSRIIDLGHSCLVGNPEDALRRQLKKADRVSAEFVIIYGSDEQAQGYYTLREMARSEQKKIKPDDFDEFLKALR
jgi:histidyl-tRNA synthetase